MTDTRKLIADVLNIPQDRINDDLHIKNTVEWDSLKHMELILAIEQTCSIELSGDDIADMTSYPSIKTVLARYGITS